MNLLALLLLINFQLIHSFKLMEYAGNNQKMLSEYRFAHLTKGRAFKERENFANSRLPEKREDLTLSV